MRIVIPSAEGKLCGHFGHCESFTFVDIDLDANKILSIESRIPEDGISCGSAVWIAEQGADIVLAGGMGARPMMMFADSGIQVITGCPELEIESLVQEFMNQTLTIGENACGGEHHHCGGHHEGHCHNH